MGRDGERRDEMLPLRQGGWFYTTDLRFRARRSAPIGTVTLQESFGVDHLERVVWRPQAQDRQWTAVLDHLSSLLAAPVVPAPVPAARPARPVSPAPAAHRTVSRAFHR